MTFRTSAAISCLICVLCLLLKTGLEKTTKLIPGHNLSLQPLQTAYHSGSLKRGALGFDSALADLLWVQLLQLADHTKLKENHVSWEYAQCDALTSLDPNFEEAYSFGAIFLSVFREDKLGAKLLLQKWVKHEPIYWKAHYMLGYHLYYEMNEYNEAAKEILLASSLERAPSWLPALGIRLLSQTGALMQALRLAVELYPSVDSGFGQTRVQQRIRSLHYHLEHAAWRKALSVYRQRRHSEPKSLAELIPYRQEEMRDLASLAQLSSDIPDEVKSLLSENFHFQYVREKHDVIANADVSGLEQAGIYAPHKK